MYCSFTSYYIILEEITVCSVIKYTIFTISKEYIIMTICR
nr:MAG TPA: hypothetical protein [Caudoviricetes sp.]